MKKFSNLDEQITSKYESKDSLRNDIYSIIENSLSIKIFGESSLDKDINIIGKEELVEKIKSLIDDVKIKERVLTLEHVKANVHRNFDMNWLNEQIDSQKNNKIITIGWQDKFFSQKNGQWLGLNEINEKYITKYINLMKENGINLIKRTENEGVIYLEFDKNVYENEILSSVEKERDDEIKKL